MPDSTVANHENACKNHVEIVAELGGNVGSNYVMADSLVYNAHRAGADAVKVSLYTPEMMCPDSDAPEFQISEGLWKGQTLYRLYQKAAMPIEFVPRLKELAESLGLGFICGLYHPEGVRIAESFGIERYKVASFELGWKNLLETLAETGKPVILSCGVATPNEIEAGVEIFRRKNVTPVLLKCTSQYPARPDQMHLATLPDMKARFGCPVGLSDHSANPLIPALAATLGASLVEVHIKSSRDDDGLDASFSLDPGHFKQMVQAVRTAEAAQGCVSYEPSSTKYKRRFVEGLGWVRTVN